MKKILQLTLLCSFVFLFANSVFAVNSIPDLAKKKQGIELVKKQLSVDDFLEKDRSQIEAQLGTKLSLKERMALKVMQKRAKRALKKGSSKDAISQDLAAGNFDFNVGAFFLGLLLGLIGILLVYLLMEKEDAKSAWLGFGIWILILLLASV